MKRLSKRESCQVQYLLGKWGWLTKSWSPPVDPIEFKFYCKGYEVDIEELENVWEVSEKELKDEEVKYLFK